jgi:hypothetical protein
MNSVPRSMIVLVASGCDFELPVQVCSSIKFAMIPIFRSKSKTSLSGKSCLYLLEHNIVYDYMKVE